MVKEVVVYVEGGSRGAGKNESANIALRRAFSKLAEKFGVQHSPRFVPCGGRSQTFDAAWNAFLNRSGNQKILMLVDGEDPSNFKPVDCWKHLRKREGSEWSKLTAKHKKYIHMMATCMETWLVADVNGLRIYFGSCLVGKHLKDWPNLEERDRGEMFSTLLSATAKCGEKHYMKGEFSFDLLSTLDPKSIGVKCPHAKRFFETLALMCA